MSKTHQKFYFRMEQKLQHFILHACRSLQCISFIAFGLKKNFVEEGDPRDLFCPIMDPPPDGYGPKKPVRDHEHFIPTKFRKNQVS